MSDELSDATKISQQMVTKIYELVTMQPTEKIKELDSEAAEATGRFKESNTKVHLCIPGIPLYEEDFEEMYTLQNPTGVKSRNVLFSILVDSIPAAGSNRYYQTPRRVSNAYRAIVQAANSQAPPMDPKTKERMDEINEFLQCKVEEEVIKFPKGKEKPKVITKWDKTDVYKRYEALIDEIEDARSEIIKIRAQASGKTDWEIDYTEDELKGMDPQRKKQLANKALRRAEDFWEEKSFGPLRRYKKLRKEFDGDANMKYVKQALDYQATHGNELTAGLLANCKSLADLGEVDSMDLDVPIKLCFPSSMAFLKKNSDEGYTHISCNTKDYKRTQHKVDVSAGLDLKGMIKIVTFGVKAGGGTTVVKSKKALKNVSVEFDVCFVNIIRPWMDATLFSKYIEWDAGSDQGPGSISSGKKEDQTDDHLLPFITMQMIVAKNVKLKADWKQEQKDFVEQHAKGGFSIGWGPFKIGPSAKESSSHLNVDKKTGDSYLDLKGIQCIGFVSWVPPFCAPKDGKDSSNKRPLADRLPKGKDEQIEEEAKKLEEQLSFPPDQRETS